MDNNPIVNAIFEGLREGLNKEADKIIEDKTDEFRRSLVETKNNAISDLLTSIAIVSEHNMDGSTINLNIKILPSSVPRKEFR